MTANGTTLPSPILHPRHAGVPGRRALPVRMLLECGIIAGVLYLAMVAFVPLLWPAYDSGSQTVSELSAIGAPTRDLWVPLGLAYTVLLAAFGGGVWAAARGVRALKIAGALLVAYGLLGLGWPPMHLRGEGFTLTDRLHIVWTFVCLGLMVGAMIGAALALGRRFRVYTFVTIALLVGFGWLAGLAAPEIQANLPTPLVGVWQRVNIAASQLWLVVFASVLLRRFRLQEGTT